MHVFFHISGFHIPTLCIWNPPPPRNSLTQIDSETCVINMHVCVFRLKGKNDSGWKTRLQENWMMLKLLMVWLEKRPYINAGESWNQRCVFLCQCVSICPCFYTDFHSCEHNSKHTLNGSPFSHISLNPILVPNITQTFDNSILSL